MHVVSHPFHPRQHNKLPICSIGWKGIPEDGWKGIPEDLPSLESALLAALKVRRVVHIHPSAGSSFVNASKWGKKAATLRKLLSI